MISTLNEDNIFIIIEHFFNVVVLEHRLIIGLKAVILLFDVIAYSFLIIVGSSSGNGMVSL